MNHLLISGVDEALQDVFLLGLAVPPRLNDASEDARKLHPCSARRSRMTLSHSASLLGWSLQDLEKCMSASHNWHAPPIHVLPTVQSAHCMGAVRLKSLPKVSELVMTGGLLVPVPVGRNGQIGE